MINQVSIHDIIENFYKNSRPMMTAEEQVKENDDALRRLANRLDDIASLVKDINEKLRGLK